MRAATLAALVPAISGLAIALLLFRDRADRPLIYVRVDLGTLTLLGGLTLSAFLLLSLAIWQRHRRGIERTLSQTQSEAALDRRRFLLRLDHELKNPLTAIRAGLVNVFPERSEDALVSVNAQVLRISRLTADLRKLAELEMRPLERSPVNMAELLKQVTELAQERPEAASRTLTLTLPRAPWPIPTISADRDLLLLAFHNLLDNALKFGRPGDTIEIRAFEDSAFVVIEVADTGPGIREEDAPFIWQELYRGQDARGAPGSGLGLALTRAVIERHDGQVTFRTRVGQGTVFTVRLPFAKTHQ